MTKTKIKTKTNKAADVTKASEEVTTEVRGERPQRRKVYQRPRDTDIPDDVRQTFLKDGYELKLVRWLINGEEDYRYLARRENEGYEFVKESELPVAYVRALRLKDTSVTKGLVTTGDLCLMKIDSDLRQSRREYFQREAKHELEAVDINILEKKGLRNVGSKTQVLNREPSFQA